MSKSMSCMLGAVAMGLLGWTGRATAQAPEFIEDAAVVGAGAAAVETGVTYARQGGTEAVTLPEFLARYGVSPRLELQAALNSYCIVDDPSGAVSGFENVDIAAKYALREQVGGAPAVALMGGLCLPTGSDAVADNSVVPSLLVALGWSFGERLSLTTNHALAFAGPGGGRYWEHSHAVALGYVINDRWGTHIEYLGTLVNGDNGPNTNYLDTGLSYVVNDRVSLDATVGVGLSGDSDYFMGFGSAYAW